MNSPLFIVGPPRSGTTLVAEVLNQHPKIHISLETNYFEEVYPTLEKKSSLPPTELAEKIIQTNKKHLSEKQLSNYWFEQTNKKELEKFIQKETSTPVSPLTAYLKYQAQIHNKNLYGEKTPRHVFHLDTIKKYFPESPFILITRDGKDFLASYKRKHGKNRPPGNRPLYHPVVTSFMWRRAVKKLFKYQNDSHTYNLSYEKLAHKPKQQIKKLCDFLNIDFESSMLQPNTSNTSYDDKNKKAGIKTNSVGKWREELTNEEVYIFEQIAGSQAENLGYQLKKPSIKKFKVMLHCFSTPLGFLRALITNRKRIPILWSYIKKRV